MSGKKSRGIGNRGELRAAKMLTEDGRWGKVVTARKGLAGTRRGEDLVEEYQLNGIRHYRILPVAVEVKAGEQSFTEDWIKQAAEQAQWCAPCVSTLRRDDPWECECEHARPWLLIWIPKFCRSGREWMIEPCEKYGWSMTWFDNWKDH